LAAARRGSVLADPYRLPALMQNRAAPYDERHGLVAATVRLTLSGLRT
jgi:hypothetical protein